MCLWGFGKGVVDGPVLALFADSIPTGDRWVQAATLLSTELQPCVYRTSSQHRPIASRADACFTPRTKFYFYLYVVFWVGALAGPVMAIVVFATQSNDWTFAELSVVLYVALTFKV